MKCVIVVLCMCGLIICVLCLRILSSILVSDWMWMM